jgi:phosphoribosylanthranilate isomerase
MTYVKICGITNLDDARGAVEAGADFLGFNFYPPSPRYITPERAKEIISEIRLRPNALESSVKMFGVFVNHSLERVRIIADECGLDLLQLHGDETVDMVMKLSPRAFKALRPRTVEEMHTQLERYGAAIGGSAPSFIVDAHNPKLFGGTGERADWTIARNIASQYPILLAGGLAPENVSEAIDAVRPWGVDTTSGVERAPGLKDAQKVKRFVENVRRLGG